MKARELFEKLAQRAMSSIGVTASLRRPRGKPGEWIERLSPEEREELQKLKSDEVESPDPHLMYLCGQYPENTTTIHTHTVKKDEDE